MAMLNSPPSLTVALESVNNGPLSTYNRLLESSAPSLRKSAGRVSPAERQFAFDTACQCVEESLGAKESESQHARYFRKEGYKVLKEALQTDILEDSFQASVSTSGASFEEETAESQLNDLQLKDTASSAVSKKMGIWRTIKRRLSTESPGKASDSLQKFAMDKSSPSPIGGRHHRGVSQEDKAYTFVSINVEKSFALLVAVAPSRGEVQHWVWLLRAYMNKCSIENTYVMLSFLARAAKNITPDEEWMRLLTMELSPVLAVMLDNDLPASSQTVLRVVADRAMQIGEEAVLNFRCHRSSRLENSALLAKALQLQILVAKCASGADCTDMGGLFEELLTLAAQQRFRSLVAKLAADAGLSSPTSVPGRDASSRSMASMAAVCEQLVQDISDDEECYQAAFPPECNIVLPAISCRVYCNLLRGELSSLLTQGVGTDRPFFALFKAVGLLEQSTRKWSPTTLGQHGSLCNLEGRLLFLSHIEAWMRATRSKLMQWSMRLLKEEVWQHAAAGSMAGLRCSPSLVELFRALCSVAEDSAAVCAAHPCYTGLMERMLSKVVMVHVAGLERLCQGEMPARSSHKLTGPLSSIGSRRGELAKGPFQPSSSLCMLLNDLREIRSKQADLSNAVRANVPAEWWGKAADGGQREKMRLGDRFKLCQVEIERRYAAVLHHTVKRMMEGMTPLMSQLLSQPSADDPGLSVRAEPLTSCLDDHLARLLPLLDVRVLRRISRELWNTLAGLLHDDLLDCQEGRGSNVHQSLGNVGPRIQHVDAVLKHLSNYIVGHKMTGLTQEDEPEKVTKLRKMLALFMREDEGRSIDSL